MRAAGLLMMAIGVVLLIAPLAVAQAVGWTTFIDQGPALVALYGLLMLMGVALIVLGRRMAFPKT